MGARDTEVTWRDLLPILRQTGRQRIPVSAKGCEEEKAGFRQSQGGEGTAGNGAGGGGSFLEEGTFELSPKGWRGMGLAQMSWGEAFQAEGTDGAKALGQEEQLEAQYLEQSKLRGGGGRRGGQGGYGAGRQGL